MYVADSDEQDVLVDASRLLDEAKSVGEIKLIRDKAEAVRTYARAARLGLAFQNRAAALKLRAERKAGRLLAALKLRGGDRRSKDRRSPLKLADMGVSRAESKRWQQMASIAETKFCEYLEAMNCQSREVTATGLLRSAKAGKDKPLCGPFLSDCEMMMTNHRRPVQVETVLELSNHVRLLTEVLRPVCASSNLQLAFPEVKVIGKLLFEMGELTRELTSRGERRPQPSN
jgi:hypothetical protein